MLDPRAGSFTHSQLTIKAKNLFRCASLLAFSEYLSQFVEVKLHMCQPTFYNFRVHDLICSDERRMISYLKKRIPCSCLDVKYKEVKTQKKMSVCANLACRLGRVEFNSMLSCKRCRKAHYCSQQCQAEDHHMHKEECDIWRKYDKLLREVIGLS